MSGIAPEGVARRRCTACGHHYDHVLFAVLLDHKSVRFIAHKWCLYCRRATGRRRPRG